MKKANICILAILFLVISNGMLEAQVSVLGNAGAAGNYCGWNAAQLFPLTVAHKGNFPINFQTNGVQRMTIMNTTGFVGIGLPGPLWRLDVQDNINVNTTGFVNGYRINGFTVLQTPGLENVFVGRGAGANFAGGTLGENTFVGFNAGGSYVSSNTSGGDRNTFIGRAAGFALTNGRYNTFVGCDAGLILATGSSNTFVGEHAGYRQVSGDNNVFIGSHAGQGPPAGGTGQNNTFVGTFCGPNDLNGDDNTFTGYRSGVSCNTGQRNCFYGKWSGLNTINGDENVAMGYRSGRYNRNGNNNTYLGTDAGVPNAIAFNNLDNVTSLGFNALARAANTMILGDNSVNVGIGLSNDAIQNGPQNKLEIDAGLNLTDVQPSGQSGASGLRFRDLHLGNTPGTANGVCLSVDASGDVILVDAGSSLAGAHNGASPSTINPGFVAWGQDVAQPGNPGQLLGDREIPMNGFNVFFTEPVSSTVNQNRVQVGNYSGSTVYPSFAKISAINRENNSLAMRFGGFFSTTEDFDPTSVPLLFNPVYFGNISATYKVGVLAIASDNNLQVGRYIGLSAGAYSTSSQNNVGVSGKAYGSTAFNTGVYGIAGGTDAGATYYGISGTSMGAGTNIGVYGTATGGSADYAGYFDGDVYVNGPTSGTGFLQVPSDQNIKTNIDTIADALNILAQLEPRTFYFDTLNSHNLKLSSEKQYGLIAQDVETILPELVSTTTKPADYDTSGNVMYTAFTYKTVNYTAFIALLIEGMQEQQSQIDSLQAQINTCCSNNARTSGLTTNQQNVTLTNSESIVLNQNVPNPFAEQTTITYHLPESVVKAQMMFYDMNGKLIQVVDIDGRGPGQLNVFADDLSNGIYSYALVADGQVIDTKQMVKSK